MPEQSSRTRGLVPFKKGQSGNPGGRPVGLSLTRLVREELLKPTVEGSKVTKGEVVAARVVDLAQAGHPTFVPLVWKYVDGEPKAAADLTLRELVEQLAERMGLDPKALLAEFERDMKASGAA